jgi:hypothetical protein
MKNISALLLLFILNTPNLAQIPNASFENWTGGNPDDWFTTNLLGTINITQVPDAHHGSSALHGLVIPVGNDVLPPYVWTISPVISRPPSMTGYYKFFPTLGDEFWVYVSLFRDTAVVGVGFYSTDDTRSSYLQFSADINYLSEEEPDMALIQFLITGSDESDPHVGSYFIIDHLEFSGITDVKDNFTLYSYNLAQNYPNPFNPSTVISFQLPQEVFVTLKIYDILGNEVTTLVNEVKPAGDHNMNFDASGLSNGVYIYSFSAGPYQQTRKMILLK